MIAVVAVGRDADRFFFGGGGGQWLITIAIGVPMVGGVPPGVS